MSLTVLKKMKDWSGCGLRRECSSEPVVALADHDSVVVYSDTWSDLIFFMEDEEDPVFDLEDSPARESMTLRGTDLFLFVEGKEDEVDFWRFQHRRCRNGRRGPRPAQKPRGKTLADKRRHGCSAPRRSGRS